MQLCEVASMCLVVLFAMWVVKKHIYEPYCAAKRVADMGWVLYTMPGCGHCEEQLSELGCVARCALIIKSCPGGTCAEPPPVDVSKFPTWLLIDGKVKRKIVGKVSPGDDLVKALKAHPDSR